MGLVTQLQLAVAALAGTTVVYALLAVLWSLRARADRAAAAGLDGVYIDPYHAVATAGTPQDADEPAAAALLLEGLLLIDADGRLSAPAGAGDDTAHPVPAALLDAVRRRGPVALRGLVWDSGLRVRRGAFLRERSAALPRWSGREKDGLGAVAYAVPLVPASFWAIQLVFRGGPGPTGVGGVLLALALTVIAGLMIAAPLIWLALRFWPDRRDPFRAHCAGLPPHPAMAGLDAEQRGLLRKSRLHREPWEREDISWVDSGGAF